MGRAGAAPGQPHGRRYQGQPLVKTTTYGVRVSCRFVPQVNLPRSVHDLTARSPGALATCLRNSPVRPAERRIWPSNRANSGMRSLVSAVPRHRRKRKIRRTGLHTTPSQVEKVAQTAGKAAPAVVVVGTLATTAPHIGGAAVTASPAATAPHVVRAHLDDATLPAGLAHPARSHATAARTYTVQTGNTLSGITQRFYGQDANWRSLYAANESTVSDPNMIYVGEELRLPRHLPAPAAGPAHRRPPRAARTRRRTPPGTRRPARPATRPPARPPRRPPRTCPAH